MVIVIPFNKNSCTTGTSINNFLKEINNLKMDFRSRKIFIAVEG